MHLFYKMLFFLTGVADLDRKTLRTWSEDRYLRENPERLEEVAVALWDVYKKKQKTECDLAALRAAQTSAADRASSPPPVPAREFLRRLRRRAASLFGLR